MKNQILLPLLAAAVGALFSSQAADASNFVAAADISGATPSSTHSGWLGVRFGVEAGDIPAGQTVEVTKLAFFAGSDGQFAGGGVVDFDHQVSLFGPRPWDSRNGDYTGLEVASVNVSAGNPVDGDGWSWVSLAEPVALVGGQYYFLGAAMLAGQASDPYFDPYAGPEGTASIVPPGAIFRNQFGDTYMAGRYGLGAGLEAFSESGYLTSNLEFQVVPEPSTYAAILGAVCLVVLFGRRRRRRA